MRVREKGRAHMNSFSQECAGAPLQTQKPWIRAPATCRWTTGDWFGATCRCYQIQSEHQHSGESCHRAGLPKAIFGRRKIDQSTPPYFNTHPHHGFMFRPPKRVPGSTWQHPGRPPWSLAWPAPQAHPEGWEVCQPWSTMRLRRSCM